MSVYLCGETGIINRGCEAIIRSTIKLLNLRSGDIYLATSSPEMDLPLIKELGINMIKYNPFPTKYHRYFAAVMRRMRHSIDGKFLQAELFSHLSEKDLCLNIGGDTYCYGRPSSSIELNNFTAKNGINNILWCCSVEADVMQGEVLLDLKKYRYIFAREKITYNNLIKAGINKDRIVKCCDPAFFLDKKEVELPKGFTKGNTIGINISEMIVSEKYPGAYSSIVKLIREILEKTDMAICLIPHVYSIERNLCDWQILSKIYGEFRNERVCIVDKEYSCEQLKYIISECRFIIAARTHASIAAYSSGVPTLVLGYSIKSKGIAQDLFETDEHFVLPNEKITPAKLSEDFWFIYNNELTIRERLYKYLPEYKQQLLNSIGKIRGLISQNNTICDLNLCTGCQCCKEVCPNGCIIMKRDSMGFYYPEIDREKCIFCGKCLRVCPVANRYRDDNMAPLCYVAVNKDDNTRKKSSSGGVFAELAKQIIADSGAVFGASFDEKMRVCLRECSTESELDKICGAKYVQADVCDTYKKAETYLKSGKKVLYSGTPCQVAGLKAYLGKDYNYLFTVDIICHGVPSPRAWNEYIESIEKKYNSKIEQVNFRCKDSGWQTYSLFIKFSDGKIVKEKVTENIYLKAFISHLIIRPSCFECAFKQKHRQTDITLGDFWGVNKWNKEFNDDKGISVVFIHSDKGRQLFESIKNGFECESIEFSHATMDNASYLQSCDPSPYQRLFYKKWSRKPFLKAIKMFCENGRIQQNYRMIQLLTNWKWK